MTTEEETGKPSNLGSTHNQEHEHKEGQQEQKLKEQQKNERQSTLAQAKRSIAYPAAKKKKNQTDFVETCLRTTTTTGATTAAHKVATGSAMLAKEKQYIAYPKQRKSVSQTDVPPAANTNEAKSGEVSALLAHEKRHVAYPRSGPYDKSRTTDNKQGYRPDAEVLLPVHADSPGNSSQASKSTTDNSTLLQAAKSTTGIKYPRGETNRTAIKNVVRSDMVRNDDNRGIMPLPPPEGGFACENSEPHPSRDEPLVQEREIVLPNTDQSNSRDAGHGISNVTEVVDQATTPTDNNSGLAVATQVDENEEPTQIARPDNLHGKNGSTVTTLMILVLVGSLLIIGVIVGSICGAGLCSNKEGDVETGYSVLGDIQNRIEEAFGPDYFMKTDEPEHTQPKFKALDWIMFEDPLQLEPDSNNLLQRFIVVLTYFQTSREGDWLACGPSSSPNNETCWFQIRGSDSLASRWLTGVHECQWAGIFCDGEKSITQLLLMNNGLNGPLPAELASLLALESIDFPGNQLTGSIPVELLGSPLSKILLTNNLLTGTVPTEVGLFDGVTLGFGSNSLSGSIPTELFQAGKRISSFYFYDNKLTGTLPTEIGALHGIFRAIVYLQGNPLHGSIPSEIGLLKGSLAELYISRTHMDGSIPEELFTECTNLAAFRVSNCGFTGTISTGLQLLTRLELFDISNNKFHGTIPGELSALTKLSRFIVNGNDLSGSIPSSVCALADPTKRRFEVAADCLPRDGSGDPMVECSCCTQCCDGGAADYCLSQ